MNGGQARTPSDRVVDGYLKWAPNRSKINFICYSERNCGCLKTGGLGTTHRSVLNRSWSRWNDRIGPICAPKCPSFEFSLGGSNTRLAPYFTMFSFSTAVFCSISLASSSVVPIALLYLSLGVKIGPFHLRVTFSSVLDNLCLALAKVGAVYAWAATDADGPADVAPVRLAVLLARGLLAALLHEV